jgi:hypothetical protein
VLVVDIMSEANKRNPAPAYPAKDNAVLFGDTALYARLGSLAASNEGKTLVEEFEIPIRSGRAWVVKKGSHSPSLLPPSQVMSQRLFCVYI